MTATIRRVLFLALMLTTALAAPPIVRSAVPMPSSGEIRLDIPDIGQEKRTPKEGWCGESSIQMALAYHGAYVSQKAINRAGKPALSRSL